MIELKFVNRKVRLNVWVIQFIILTSLMWFFIICFYTKGSYEYKNTLLENLFDVDEYWRTVGYIGFPITLILLFVVPKYMLRKTGILKVSNEKIEISDKGRNSVYYTSSISEMIFTKDLPFKGDDRSRSRKAGRIQFKYGSEKCDFEFNPKTENDYKNLIPVTQYWQENITGFKVKYK